MTVRRLKTYTGSTGYVYQYYFVGKRPRIDPGTGAAGSEYVFSVTSDRKTASDISVMLPVATLEHWAAEHGRTLNDAEQYAAVKMRLFQAFDEVQDLPRTTRALELRDADLSAALATLGVE